jgi:hypothetical protein
MHSFFTELKNLIVFYPNSLLLIILTNIILIISFLIGKVVLYKHENAVKFFSHFTVFVCVIFVAYFVSILCFTLSNLFTGNAVYAAIFPVFLFMPFIIGHFTTYEKIHFYTNVQILVLIISLLLAFSFI